MSESFKIVPLSTVVQINSGIALPSIFKDVEKTQGHYPFYKVAQMNNDSTIMKGADLRFTDLESKKYKIKLFPKGSVLIPKRGGAILTNKKRLLVEDASYDSNIMGLKANNNLLIDDFLVLYMESINLSDYIDTSTIPQINNKHIDMMEIPLPKISEQQRIVSKLDLLFKKIDKSIELHQKNIDEANAFMGSVLNEVFLELEEKYGLNNLLDAVYVGCKRGFNPTIIDGKVPFIGMSDIDEKSGLNTQFVMEDYEKVSNGKTKFEKGAVLVGKIFPCTQNNKTSIVPNDIDGGFATTEVYALHCLDNMNPLYLNKYMRSKSINDYMVNTMVGATGRQRVPSETIKSINVPLPPLPIQQKVVKYLDSVSEKMEKVKSIQKEKMESLKALKASILDNAFRGEL